jgi:hypothetical protein
VAETAGSISYPLRVGDRQVGQVSVPIEIVGVSVHAREAVLNTKPGVPAFTLPETVCEACDAGEGYDLEVRVSLASGPLPIGTMRCCPTCQPDLLR